MLSVVGDAKPSESSPGGSRRRSMEWSDDCTSCDSTAEGGTAAGVSGAPPGLPFDPPLPSDDAWSASPSPCACEAGDSKACDDCEGAGPDLATAIDGKAVALGARLRARPKERRRANAEILSRPGAMLALVQRLRARGVNPHPYGVEADEAYLAAIAAGPTKSADGWGGGVVSADGGKTSTGPRLDEVDGPVGGGSGPARQGVTNLRVFLDEEVFGETVDILDDLDLGNAGWIRHLNQADLRFMSLFDREATVLHPETLQARLREDGYARFSRFLTVWFFALIRDMQISPSVFAHGGGVQENGVVPGVVVPAGSEADTDGDGLLEPNEIDAYRATVGEGRPPHQAGVILPSFVRWHPWFWDFLGPYGLPSPPGEPDREDPRVLFQRYGLNVLWREAGAWDYERECCRRKGLALAAFSQVVGEYLAILAGALAAVGIPPHSVIPYLESGNEFDPHWCRRLTSAAYQSLLGVAGDDASSEDGGPCSAEAIAQGSREFGKYHAIIATAIKLEWPQARFRAAELLSPHCPNTFLQTCDWLGWSGIGMRTTLDWIDWAGVILEAVDSQDEAALTEVWVALQEGSEAALEAVEWNEMCARAGFFWPPMGATGLANSDLCAQVGFHWYRVATVPRTVTDDGHPPGDPTYDDQTVVCDMAEVFVERAAGELGLQLSSTLAWTVGELGFPAEDLGPLVSGIVESYAGANPGTRRRCWFD